MSLTINSTIALRSGKQLPRLGFGVYQSTAALDSSRAALASKYIHIDSARVYRNESEVCQAVKEAGLAGQIFLTTKVTSKEHGDKTSSAVDESIARAAEHGQKWSLFLLHDPCSGPEKRLSAWKTLEQKQKEGKLESIGVSNFSEIHLKQLVDGGAETVPEVNQIELHPWCQQKPIVEYCQANGIVVQAYCPIVRGQRFDDPVLVKITEKLGKTGAQVLIRWSLQKGYVPLPKSDTPSRIASNAEVYDFELSTEDMAALDALDLGAAGACSWNPVGHV
ncbi:NADP-dependent oxidoreductase domain-containing protein [Leucosporidium creatinivorum]|uniref:NADP-dependent oxidoreductase domain-containing protein n=1 Tax=Leucosporidium creatinivorum TaxID=106004 RepID=A0A1Y2CN35_9BASI|nr:NADP-dependent oxidoreductase domain-containing protein [Leucosporidium creatinivorum]